MAIASVRAKGAEKVVVAVPVSARDAKSIIEGEADLFVCIDTPLMFGAVGAFYEEFGQTEDQEVVELLSTHP